MVLAQPIAPELLGSRWTELREHGEQSRLWDCEARFVVLEVGRRAGKTEIAKRRGVREWLGAPPEIEDYWVAFCAPTRDQARDIYWEDLKALTAPFDPDVISESHLSIVKNGARISVVGMDKPARIEGRPLDWVGLDEFADMKPDVWERHVRPALSTSGRPGRAWIYGVPRPSGQFKKIADEAKKNETGEWAYFHWKSKDIIPEEAEAAKRSMDPLLYAQEYEASRVNLQGLAYYSFDRDKNLEPVGYDPRAPITFCFDFNVSPGTATVLQDKPALDFSHRSDLHDSVTCVIGEVWIRDHSNTPMVCAKLIQDFGDHEGPVIGEGDATGGARGSAKVAGSDWDQIDQMMRIQFGDRWSNYVTKSNPPERSRVNAMNSRLCSADGTVGFLIDGSKGPKLVEDFESVMVLQGSAGELDKKSDKWVTHPTDGVGYHVARKYPIVSRSMTVSELM